MTDDTTKRGGQDRTRIDVSQDYELRYWSQKFGVTEEQLRQAVARVGDRAEKVKEHLSAESGQT